MEIVNTYHFTIFHASNEILSQDIMAVMTKDNLGQYAVYLGAWEVDGSELETYEAQRETAAHLISIGGNKQTLEQAIQYFPAIANLAVLYRA